MAEENTNDTQEVQEKIYQPDIPDWVQVYIDKLNESLRSWGF